MSVGSQVDGLARAAARRGDLLRLVVGDGLRAVAAGLLAGAATALAGTRLLAGLLHGVAPHDPVTFAAGLAVLLGLGLLACWLPGRRATAVDPAAVLRAD